MSDFHAVMVIATASLVTMGLRFLPFLIFGGNRSMPPMLEHMRQALPYTIMGMLVVALLHAWKRNTLLSIGAGTICYMLLVQFVF